MKFSQRGTQSSMAPKSFSLESPPNNPPKESSVRRVSRIIFQSPLKFTSKKNANMTSSAFSSVENLTLLPELDMDISLQTQSVKSYSSNSEITTGNQVYTAGTVSDNICCFCGGNLLNITYPGRSLNLCCLHRCHGECYYIMKNQLGKVPNCNICGEETILSTTKESYMNRLLPQQETGINDEQSNITPILQTINSFDPRTPENQILSNTFEVSGIIHHFDNYGHFNKIDDSKNPKSSFVSTPELRELSFKFNSQFYKDYTEPQIEIKVNSDSSENFPSVMNESPFSFPFRLEIRSPPIYNNSQSKSHHEMEMKDEIIERTKYKLISCVINWQEIFSDLESYEMIGDLLMFDCMNLIINDSTINSIHSYLFENFLIFIDFRENDCPKIIGKIIVSREISNIIKIESKNELILNLTNINLPEIVLKFSNIIILNKWEKYLDQLTNENISDQLIEIPLIQITSNLWKLIDFVKIPENIIKFNKLTESGLDLPIEFLNEDYLPVLRNDLVLNIIISISLINDNPHISNEDYKTNLTRFIRTTLNELGFNEKLGLIITGKNREVSDSKKGTFIGFVNSDWSGWDDILRNFQITNNLDDNYEKVFNSNYYELLVILETFKKLVSFSDVPNKGSKSNKIEKLIVLNSNDFGTANEKSRQPILDNIDKVLDGLAELSIQNYSIEFIDLNNSKSKEWEIVITHKFPTFLNFIVIHHFEKFEDFNGELSSYYQNIRNILIPRIEVTLSFDRTGKEDRDKYYISHNKAFDGKIFVYNVSANFHTQINFWSISDKEESDEMRLNCKLSWLNEKVEKRYQVSRP